jgi:hypothetical protein
VQQCRPHKNTATGDCFFLSGRGFVDNHQCVIPDITFRMVTRRLPDIHKPGQHCKWLSFLENGAVQAFKIRRRALVTKQMRVDFRKQFFLAY